MKLKLHGFKKYLKLSSIKCSGQCIDICKYNEMAIND